MTLPPQSAAAAAFFLWRRLLAGTAVTALLLMTGWILANVDGWRARLTVGEVVAEICAHLLAGLVTALALATVAALAVFPILALWRSARPRIGAIVLAIALVALALIWAVFTVKFAASWFAATFAVPVPRIPARVILLAGLAAIIALTIVPATRARTMRRLESLFTGRAARRLAVAAAAFAIIGGAASGAFRLPTGPAASVPAGRGPNILLVTFDTLSAEDMSLYGYPLPTTPNLAAFAERGTTFDHFYAVANMTTPSVGSILTGRYPAETNIIHLRGRLRPADAERSLVRRLREAGYATGAIVGNPEAHPFVMGGREAFDQLGLPPLRRSQIANALMAASPTSLYASWRSWDDMGRGVLRSMGLGRLTGNDSRFPPEDSFAEAERILEGLGTPYFLWVHIFAPHDPYQPDPRFQGRFTGPRQVEGNISNRPENRYTPDRQPLADRMRLLYDEWVLQTDHAFGNFIAGLERRGRLRNTAVIISADHGESFTGGTLGHAGPLMLRPVMHIPLIVRSPGQQSKRRVAVPADQTLIAPLILHMAGIGTPRPSGGTPGVAFSMDLDENSIFSPPDRGSVSAVDGQFQYVYALRERRGRLYRLSEAHLQTRDLSRAHPDVAARLHRAVQSRFPALLQAP